MLVIAAVLVTVAQYYHPQYGFTRFIAFPASSHGTEFPPVRDAPHADESHAGYDGQFYAQIAVEPLLQDPAIDGALDNAPYRARRILMSWIAYAAGLGRPAWILQAYSLINVVAWLLLAGLLVRIIPPDTSRGFVLWSACLTCHGMLSSIRYALPDGPSMLLIALAMVALTRRHAVLGSLVLGAAGLARETNLLAAAPLGRLLRPHLRSLLLLGVCLLICAVPILLWLDYLRSVYRSTMVVHDGHITLPLWGVGWKLKSIVEEWQAGLAAPQLMASVLAVIAWAARAIWITRMLAGPERWGPWTMTGAAYVLMSLALHPVVWDGSPGAFTRVLLPLAVATNVTMAARGSVPWPMIIAANLDVIPGVMFFVGSAGF